MAWWQVDLTGLAKVTLVKLRSSSTYRRSVVVQVFNKRDDVDVDNHVTCSGNVQIYQRETSLVCEPPLDARYIRIEALENKPIVLCEIEVYKTGIDDQKFS